MNDKTLERKAAAVLAQYDQAINGLQNDWPATQQTIIFEQATYTPAQLIAKLQQEAAPLQAVVDARSTLKTALKNRLTAMPDAISMIDGFLAMLPQYLPAGADATKFGKKTPKLRKQPTPEVKAAANLKRQATRKARHIMGKKQRAAIKAPPTPPAPATPPASPTPGQ
jgi:hypothetical protein